MRRWNAVLLVCCLPTIGWADFRPDPRSVQRHGPAYRYPQAGWIVLHIEGEPYQRGYQHGRLLAPEIAANVRCFAAVQSPTAPADGWKHTRTLVNALFLRRFQHEYLQEMKGIAEGASAAGARFGKRPLDLLDVAALNCWPEIETLGHALEATPTGLEGLRFPDEGPRARPMPKPMHCSAFAAIGPATADGKIVIGHITMFGLYPSNFYNVWLDVKPARGHRVLMQSFPGGIQSGLDYYLNDAGLIICETTLAQTHFDGKGTSVASRIRQALQYADSIDRAVAILKEENNGLYTNEWLLADTKTNEIAMFELGTHRSKLYRSSKNEWFGGTPGFYWGCNNTKDLQVRLETVASVKGRPAAAAFVPSERDKMWLRLYDRYKGKIDADFGKLAFTTPPLAAYHSLDAKFTTTSMAQRLETWALFGPPLGRTWKPTFEERQKFPEVQPLASNPWTILHAHAPERVPSKGPAVVDLGAMQRHDHAQDLRIHDHEAEGRGERATAPAWHGTLLPRRDADVWLADGFAHYERYVALEKALRKRDGEGLSQRDRDRLAVILFGYRSQYELGARARPEVPLAHTHADVRQNDWHKVALGKGVLLLHELRGLLGPEKFDRMMDDFGRAHAGQEVSVAEFLKCAERVAGKKLDDFFEPWLERTGLPGKAAGGPFSVLTYLSELEQTLIVYGSADEKASNQEAAEMLQQALIQRGPNLTVPIVSDRAVTEDDLKTHHLLLIGRPDSNTVAARFRDALPVRFGARSFAVHKQAYAHPESAVLATAANPANKRYSLVVIAGLGAAATLHAAPLLPARGQRPGEVVVLPYGAGVQALVVGEEAKVTAARKP